MSERSEGSPVEPPAASARACFELPPERPGEPPRDEPGAPLVGERFASLTVGAVSWFCRLRWLVAATLTAYGALGAPSALAQAGLRAFPGAWPFAVAASLAVANLAFLAHARGRAQGPTLDAAALAWARRNLWAQVAVDLLAITVVVHFVGSLDTPMAYAYLFHVSLASIYFGRSASLAVAAAAAALYLTCVGAELAGWFGRESIYSAGLPADGPWGAPLAAWVNVAGFLAVLFVMWHLVSHVGRLLRRKEREVLRSNAELQSAHREKVSHMLRTTHELKAPFAAIQAYAQVLVRGDCGELPPAAVEVAQKMVRRCRHLATEIQQMLQLANLASAADASLAWEDLDLAGVVVECLGRLETVAAAHEVRVEPEVRSCAVTGVKEHLSMLFDNLVGNAIIYSHQGGRVTVSCGPAPGGGALAAVADRGIGILPAKLPRIFEEYYRTDEAARHNKDSSGLGLAIVRRVAHMHRISVRVESAPGLGSTFTLTVPPAGWRREAT